ncbi:MAG: MoxR family ATPase [Balneolaceae bacterium]
MNSQTHPQPPLVHQDPEVAVSRFQQAVLDIRSQLSRVVVGQDEIVDHLLISLFSRGHCLLVGVPGLAKTLLIQCLSKSLGLSFTRIQFTPDLMPGDITGTEVIEDDRETGRKSFKFIRGPVFANIVLADEINRTPPKTQSALLEGMQDYSITAGGETRQLERPFFVLATQNPIEQEGTYPLPEAQLDRFMFQLWLEYPSFEEEKQIVSQTTSSGAEEIQQVLSREQILELQELVRTVPVPDGVLDAAVRLVNRTRPDSPMADDLIKRYVRWGAGPRASQNLILGGKARALSRGRANVSLEDVKALAIPVLRHRMVLNYSAEAEGYSEKRILNHLVDQI